MSEMKIGFELKTIQVALNKIMPVRQIKNPQKSVDRYKMILASIKEVGLVEPLIVYPPKGLARDVRAAGRAPATSRTH